MISLLYCVENRFYRMSKQPSLCRHLHLFQENASAPRFSTQQERYRLVLLHQGYSDSQAYVSSSSCDGVFFPLLRRDSLQTHLIQTYPHLASQLSARNKYLRILIPGDSSAFTVFYG